MSEILKKGTALQEVTVESGNELAAIAASQINYHLMGYFPISPSTEIPQYIDEMKVDGKNSIHMIAADGEHGAFGICYGASTAGGRVLNATSANGLLYAIEQMPVQAGTRFPMVLNIVNRTVSGPLNIKGDHSDVMMTLNTGWLMLFAKDGQAVYDFNICAPKIAEHKDVRVPIAICFDGNFTSHQKKKIQTFVNQEDVQNFVGPYVQTYSSVDPYNPITIGSFMNEPDLLDNHYQLYQGIEKAIDVIEEVFEEFEQLSGRKYSLVHNYQAEDADVIIVTLGSSCSSVTMAIDNLRAQGKKVGLISPVAFRPFPRKALVKALSHAQSIIVLDRQDTYNGLGGNLGIEIKALMKDANISAKVVSRIYGLGGKDFFISDAEDLFQEALTDISKMSSFEYFGLNPGIVGKTFAPGFSPLSLEQQDNGISTEMGEDGKLKVSSFNLRDISKQVKRLGPGHGACNGCGIFSGLNTFLRGIKGHVTVLFQTGCGMVVSSGYPYTSHKVTYVHNLFQNGAATLSGIADMFEERKNRGEIAADEELTFIMFTGDGGVDIGMGSIIGTANRNHKLIILEYDNEGYMNTGHQLSYSTPLGHATTTSHIGKSGRGKVFTHKDTAQIMAATGIPYVFTGVESQPVDLIKKAAKAQWYAKNMGMAYGKIMSACPLNWKSEDRLGTRIVDMAVKCNFFPIYEVEQGITNITYNPDKMKQTIPVTEWLKMMGKTKHILKPEYADILKSFQDDVDWRWNRLKEKHENSSL